MKEKNRINPVMDISGQAPKDPEHPDYYAYRGVSDRDEYLRQISGDFQIPLYDVKMKALELGAEEDFTGLVEWAYAEDGRLRDFKSSMSSRLWLFAALVLIFYYMIYKLLNP